MRRTLYVEFTPSEFIEFTFSCKFGADAECTLFYIKCSDIMSLIEQLNIVIPHDNVRVNDEMYMPYAEAMSRQLRGQVTKNVPQSPITNAELASAVRRVSNVELEYLMTKYHEAQNKPMIDPTPRGRKRMANFVSNMTRGQYSREQVDEIVDKIIADGIAGAKLIG